VNIIKEIASELWCHFFHRGDREYTSIANGWGGEKTYCYKCREYRILQGNSGRVIHE